MNLVVDIGNTRIKAGVFDKEKLIFKGIVEKTLDLIAICDKFNIKNAIIASVNKNHDVNLGNHINCIYLNPSLKLPFENLYKTPHTLGQDRIAGVSGALSLYPSKDCLVIDAGTCITYDFIDKEKKYKGGSISPGINMRFKALHNFTSGLPFLEGITSTPLTGSTTEESIKSGVLNGVLAEITGIIDKYIIDFPELLVIICGGDIDFFENNLKGRIFAQPDLVLIGLNRILLNNAL